MEKKRKRKRSQNKSIVECRIIANGITITIQSCLRIFLGFLSYSFSFFFFHSVFTRRRHAVAVQHIHHLVEVEVVVEVEVREDAL